MRNGCKSPAGLAVAMWLAQVPNAEAREINIYDLFIPSDHMTVASYRGCPATATGLKVRLAPLMKQLQVTSFPSASTMPQAHLTIETPASNAVLASPGHIARPSRPIMIGVAY